MTQDRATYLLDQLVRLRNEGRISRRQFARLTGGGVGLAAISAFIAACGSQPSAPTPAGSGGGQASGGTSATPGGTSSGASPTAGTTEQVKRGGRLTFALDTAPVGLDPHLTTAFSSQMFYEHIYDSLFQFTPDLQVVPALAESFEVIDEKTYEFKIRQGVKFHDGSPLTVEDVKFSFERMLDPNAKSTRSVWFSAIDGLEAKDESTLVVHLKQPFAPLVGFMAMPGAAIVSKSFTEKNNNDLTAVANGTGPFVFKEYITNQQGTLVKFADHWRENVPIVDELIIQITTDEASRMAALRAQQVDMTRLFDKTNADLLAGEGYQLYKGLCTSYTTTFINCRKPPFNDPRVRQALSYAIDRKQFLDTAAFGEGEIAGPIPPADRNWALPTSEYATYKQDVEKAKQLLAEAGYANGFTVRLTVSPQYQFDVTNAQVLQSQLKPLGINVEIQQVEWGNLLNTINKTRDFELLNIIYTHQPDPDGYTYNYFHSKSLSNHSGLEDARLDELLDRGRSETDPAERKKIYAEVQKLVADELVPVLFYYSYYQYLPAQTYVKGYKAIPSLSRIYLRETWLDK
ncbi:MAG: ABC transporter substrate-binding protein [Sphaerobacter sp.]|nr:ABC transporter substrate-binding protein [Sphaerobacter sp.]